MNSKRKLPTEDILIRFGRRISDLRTQGDMTQADMATQFGIDRSYLSNVERGRKAPSLPMIEVFAKGFRTSLSELMKGL